MGDVLGLSIKVLDDYIKEFVVITPESMENPPGFKNLAVLTWTKQKSPNKIVT